MIVCVCNALRESEVRSAVRHGARNPGTAYRRLGCQLQCGQCVPFAKRIIAAERAIAC